jgi:GT2 family glycosyltransferase
MQIGLSVIIVNYNTRQMTLECLETLYSSLAGLPAEVFVVDNASQDGSATAIRAAYPQVRSIENQTNRGFGPANNQAMRLARGNYILLLNTDAFPKPHAISNLIAHLDSHPDVAIVGPRLLNRDGSLQKSCYPFPSPARATCDYLMLTAIWPDSKLIGDYRNWPHDSERSVDFVVGACMLIRRSAIESVGLFDEDFFFYGEETDWCQRFHRAGWKVCFTPDAEVCHLNGASGKAESDAVFDEFRRAQERYIRKHHGRLGLLWFWIVVVIGSVARVAIFGFLAAVQPSRRSARLGDVKKWRRIFLWTLGRRGLGLGRPTASSAAQDSPLPLESGNAPVESIKSAC